MLSTNGDVVATSVFVAFHSASSKIFVDHDGIELALN